MKKYANVVRAVMEMPWAILPGQLAVIIEIVRSRAEGEELTVEQVRERLEAAADEQGERQGALAATAAGVEEIGYVAVLPIYGTIMPRATLFSEFSGGTSVQGLRETLRAAVGDDSVKAIILDIDSPGGAVPGITELATEIREARGAKPIIAVANYLAASAAYWLAAQADEVVVSPSAMVGSIGVYTAHTDVSELQKKLGVKTTLISAGKHKTEGNPFEPLSAEAEAAIQKSVDEVYGWFTSDVAKGRGVKLAEVVAGYGQGRLVQAEEAVALGMADSIGTLGETIARVVADASRSRGRARAAASAPETVAYVPLPSELVESLTPILAGTFTTTTTNLAPAPGALAVPVLAAEADRPVQMEPTPEIEETAVEPVAAAESVAQADPARAEMFQAITALTEAVQGMNAGKVDRETVEAMKDELETLRKEVDEKTARTGYVPEDLLVAGRKLGVAELHAIPAHTGAAISGRPVETISEFHRVSDNLLLLAAATKKSPRELGYFADSFVPAMGAMAMDSTTTAEGDEWVPTMLSGNLIERVEMQLRVAALFRSIDMPSNPYEIPGFGVRTRGGRASENTADTGQTGFRKITPGTRKITLTAVKFAAEALVSKEAEEDSLVPILDFIREEITSQLAHDMEDAIINGDVTATHMDSNVTDALDPRKNWAGLRKLAIAAAKTDGAAAILTAAMLRTNRKKMGKYGVDSGQLVHIVGIGQYINLLSDVNLLTVDKYGPQATILSGELARVDGIPIVVSEYVQTDLNATGVHDGVTVNRSVALTVNRNGYLLGSRRALTVQILKELYAEYDQDAITVSMRKAFVPRQVPTTEPTVALTYNLAI